jgi:hypothetical protein
MIMCSTGILSSTRLEYVRSSLTASKGQRRRDTVQHCTGTLLWYLLQLVVRSYHLSSHHSSHHCVNNARENDFLRHIFFENETRVHQPSLKTQRGGRETKTRVGAPLEVSRSAPNCHRGYKKPKRNKFQLGHL